MINERYDFIEEVAAEVVVNKSAKEASRIGLTAS